MSVTTTSNPTTTELHRVLNDYAIHLTGVDTEPVNPRSEPAVVKPEDWPDDNHNIPAYRPINRHLDYEERPGGTNPIERLFIYTMLHGVWLNATVAQAWRKTGGKINDQVCRYKIGGEW